MFYAVGILFGIIMSKSEAVSWYRNYEMFRFESFHMFGIIGTAVVLSAIVIYLMKKLKIKTLRDTFVSYNPMQLRISRHLIAGSIFGMGWGLASCPAPMFVMLGHGFWIFIIVIIGASLGTFTYGLVKDKLPH